MSGMSGRDRLKAKRAAAREARALQPLLDADGSYVRDLHPKFATTAARVDYLTDLVATKQWSDSLLDSLADDWEISRSEARRLAQEARRRVEAWTPKQVLQLTQTMLARWVMESAGDRVKAAELLLKTVGALRLQHDHMHQLADLSDEQVQEKAIGQLVSDPGARELLRNALKSEDAKQHASVEILEARQLEDGSSEKEDEE
jgi:hypothetical protein